MKNRYIPCASPAFDEAKYIDVPKICKNQQHGNCRMLIFATRGYVCGYEKVNTDIFKSVLKIFKDSPLVTVPIEDIEDIEVRTEAELTELDKAILEKIKVANPDFSPVQIVFAARQRGVKASLTKMSSFLLSP